MKKLKSLLLSLRPVGILMLWAVGVLVVVQAVHGPDEPSTGGTLIFSADFSDATLTGWTQGTPDPGWKKGAWTVRDGRLHGEKIHNAALWLDQPLPPNVRIEFDARALSEKGDVKCEVFGDGRTHQSGYILIHGGWDNRITTLARQDEHGEDRKVDNRDCLRPGGRPACVEPNLDYHWAVERSGDDVKWYLDGRLQLVYRDPHPVRGAHFAFNNWEAPVSFDNLKIYDTTSK